MIFRPRFRLAHFLTRKGRGAYFLICAAFLPTVAGVAAEAAHSELQVFRRDIQPIIEEYCYDCHGDGFKKGGVQLDGFETEAQLRDNKLWMRALRNVRSGIMPPADEPQLPADLAAKISEWIKRGPFALDPHHPDPGRITVRRLNRVDYRNTIRDLMGVDYDTQKEFPADDTGHGFDNIGDVLTISPMLLEKYLDAAQTIVASVVPTTARAVAENVIDGRAFALEQGPVTIVASDLEHPSTETSPSVVSAAPAVASSGFVLKRPAPEIVGHALDLSYYTPATVASEVSAPHAGKYRVTIDLKAIEKYVDDEFDYNRCRFLFKIDGQPLLDREFVRQGEAMALIYTYEQEWAPGNHDLTFEVQPIAPDREQKRLLRIRVNSVRVEGPIASEYWVKPNGYDHFFPQPVPVSAEARAAYAEELLRKFAGRAFRRPVDEATLNRLVAVAAGVYSQPAGTFEAGIAQAMVAVLASPRFIFREEGTEPMQPGQRYAQVDEYALASRLSYFFWSSMPDDELFRLAAAGQLRANLSAQIDRMMKSPHSEQFVRNFTGQWLEARDITSVQINAFAIYMREHPDPALEKAQATFRHLNGIPEAKRTAVQVAEFTKAKNEFFASLHSPKPSLTGDLRYAMQRETEMDFAYMLKEDRSLLDMIECDYTFLNEALAKHYGISGVIGSQMRKVQLPPGSPRGGVLTQGTTLAVTSNPTRTSPVKRGVFILAAILGTPPAPPPPNIPPLEDAAGSDKSKPLTLRESLALHRSNKLCSSCHGRMDPLGLALENFNAMGAWRDRELDQPVDPAGQLITGEKFTDIRELKHILATKHRQDYYYCIAEKMLTYALGRGVEYYDTDTLDQLVAQLEASGGRASVLLKGIVDSAPFQQSRPRELTRTAEQNPAPSPNPQG
ncbi:MAG: DUF1592 domain-containing protein [Lacunisphaera sp.]